MLGVGLLGVGFLGLVFLLIFRLYRTLSQEGYEPLAISACSDERSALLSGDALLNLQDEQACSFFVDIAIERCVFQLILPCESLRAQREHIPLDALICVLWRGLLCLLSLRAGLFSKSPERIADALSAAVIN